MTSKASLPSEQLPILQLLRARAALRRFVAVNSMNELSAQMLNVGIAWQVYATTHSPMSLAYVGLARFLPTIGLTLFAGQAADRLDRGAVIIVALFSQAACVATLGSLLALNKLHAGAIYLLLALIGSAQAFAFPAMSAIEPQLVPAEEFPRAVAISSSAFQVSSLVGPAIGGLLFAASAPAMFVFSAVLLLLATAHTLGLTNVQGAPDPESERSDENLLGGIRYIRSNRLLLSMISLDLFAVLLGGITALLPLYAKDILMVGPASLGFLRCAPGVGAAIVGVVLTRRTIQHGAGKLMLACVAGFGAATVVFALSRNIWLSIGALMLAGGFDMVSMVIRHTMVQIATPDAMRGRVSAVQWMFIGTSSELGEFESGATAALFGTVPAALLGGLGTLAIVALWSRIFPELSSVERLVGPQSS